MQRLTKTRIGAQELPKGVAVDVQGLRSVADNAAGAAERVDDLFIVGGVIKRRVGIADGQNGQVSKTTWQYSHS